MPLPNPAQLRSVSPDDSPVCSACNGTGIEYDAQTRSSRKCVHCRKVNSAESLQDRACVPVRYRNCSFENYHIDPNDKKQAPLVNAVLSCKRFVREFPLERGLGLLFLGPCGVGKTHLASAVINNLMHVKKVPCLFYDFRDLLKSVQETYNPNTQSSELKVLKPVYEAEVLVLDELGAGKPTEWVKDTITHILNTRYNEQKTTIITSNYLDKSQEAYDETLEERIGVRLRSRLYEMCKTIVMEGEDYRQKHFGTPTLFRR
jgi:DNA replication protein DnaC